MADVGVRSLDWRDSDTEECSIHRTLALIGVRRFDDFRRHLGVSEAVLSDRLKHLVSRGIFETREYQEPGQRRRNEYRLTAKGWDLFPILISLMQWGDEHLGGKQPWEVQHRECGHPVRAEVRCTHDGEALTPRDTRLVPRPETRTRL
jgi:DNA-binding HxlR family transcriptional regulator